MTEMTRYSAIIILAAGSFAAASAPALAFNITGSPTAMQAAGRGAVAAYTQADNAGADEDFLLSPAEVTHIRWCAKRYPSYHATDNTYAPKTGARAECRSPI
jgi:hypothetical protein